MSDVFLKFTFTMGIRGYHVYKKDWTPYIGEKLHFDQENDNQYDCCAVAVVRKSKNPITLEANHKVVGHVPLEISRYIFFAMNHSCTFSGVVQDTHKYRSPITQGGLEIEAQITAEWASAEKAKFLVFRNYVQSNYDFEKCDKDDSKEILAGIMASIDDAADVISDADDCNWSDGEAEPILMEFDED